VASKLLRLLSLGALLVAVAAPASGQTPVEVQFLITREIASTRIKEVDRVEITTAQTVAFLSGLLITSPEDFERLLREPKWIAKIRTPAFKDCAQNLETLAAVLARSLSPLQVDQQAVRRYFEEQGKPEWAKKSEGENRLLVSLAAEVAQEAVLAQLYAQGRHEDPNAQAIRNFRQWLTNFARQGNAGVPGRDDPGIVIVVSRRVWAQTLLKREELAYMLSSLVCTA
jgi:hypothetical protein